MKKTLKSYGLFIVALVLVGITYGLSKEAGIEAVHTIGKSSKEMLLILPPVFILLGLLDVWVPRETMIRFMGEGSGLLGVVLAFLLGSAAAGPLYVVFPIAVAFMKKDVKFFNILVLIGAWSTTKFPMIMFELGALGPRFALTRLALNVPIILIMAWIIDAVLSKTEIEKIYGLAKELA
ncbi:MAG: permease [Sphaerochaetaceae bacterium]